MRVRSRPAAGEECVAQRLQSQRLERRRLTDQAGHTRAVCGYTLTRVKPQSEMSDEPAIAVAVAQGSLPPGVVEATAVGVPRVARDHSSEKRAAEAPGASSSSVPVAQAYVYSPFMAKVRYTLLIPATALALYLRRLNVPRSLRLFFCPGVCRLRRGCERVH